jgi:hypothetical protein
MLQRMEAEICGDPDDISLVTAALIENGFDVERLDWVDPEGGPTVWIMARIATRLDGGSFYDWVNELADRPSTWVVKAGGYTPVWTLASSPLRH